MKNLLGHICQNAACRKTILPTLLRINSIAGLPGSVCTCNSVIIKGHFQILPGIPRLVKVGGYVGRSICHFGRFGRSIMHFGRLRKANHDQKTANIDFLVQIYGQWESYMAQ
jgi:hypothetical protein